MPIEHLTIAVAAGFLSGIINTLAGSGSVFTLPVLLFMGLPAHIANGTNRVGILTQTFVGGWMLYVKGGMNIQSDIKYILPTIIGSALGAWTATEVHEDYLRYTIGGVMLVLLLVTWFRYGDFIRESEKPLSKIRELGGYPLLFIIGFYGGFIQLGVGIFTLAALVLFLNFTLQHANALKNMMNFFLTLPAFCVFAIKGHIMWEVGAVVAIGQTAGAFVAARYAIHSATAQLWIRRLLVVMMVVTAGELFGLFPYIRKMFF